MKWFYDSEGIKLEEMDQIKNLVLGFYQKLLAILIRLLLMAW